MNRLFDGLQFLGLFLAGYTCSLLAANTQALALLGGNPEWAPLLLACSAGVCVIGAGVCAVRMLEH